MRSASQQRWGMLAHYSLLYRRNCSVNYPADTLSVWATTGRDSIGMTPIAITSLDTMSIPKKPNRPSSIPTRYLSKSKPAVVKIGQRRSASQRQAGFGQLCLPFVVRRSGLLQPIRLRRASRRYTLNRDAYDGEARHSQI